MKKIMTSMILLGSFHKSVDKKQGLNIFVR